VNALRGNPEGSNWPLAGGDSEVGTNVIFFYNAVTRPALDAPDPKRYLARTVGRNPAIPYILEQNIGLNFLALGNFPSVISTEALVNDLPRSCPNHAVSRVLKIKINSG
jgi:hypothetical protein